MEIYTRQEAADTLKISLPTLDKYISEGHLEAYKLGKSIRIAKEQLQKFLNNFLFSADKTTKSEIGTSLSAS